MAFKIETKILLMFALSIFVLAFKDEPPGKQNPPMTKKHLDSIISFENRYMQAADSIAGRGGWTAKVYAKVANHLKFIQVKDQIWPDSLLSSVTVAYFRDKPIAYLEVPVSQTDDSYHEYDNYFYKGKLIAFKITHFVFKSNCGPGDGAIKERTIMYLDTTGIEVKRVHSVVDVNNKPVASETCYPKMQNDYIMYRSYAETPLAKFGIEADKPKK